MEGKPVVKLEKVHLPSWRVDPGGPEHVATSLAGKRQH
jgi:hypothetical protein